MSDQARMPSDEDLRLLSEVVTRVARVRRLSFPDAEDFAQSVHVWLLERRYDIFEKFAGRSSLTTYLTTVVNRLLSDWRNAMYGKWRPSAAARRLGSEAVALERHMFRDGRSASEAVEIVSQAHRAAAGRLWELAQRLPVRRRRITLSDDALAELPAAHLIDLVERAEQARQEQRRRAALAASLRKLAREDRWLLHARYRDGRTIRAVAHSLNVEARPLYRRYERVLTELRRSVTEAVSEL